MRLFIVAIIAIAAIGVVVFFSMPAIKEVRRSRAIEREIEGLKEEAEKIGSENSFLREQVEYLKSDHYKERLAKDKLNLRNPGEQVVIVQPSTRDDALKQEQSEGNESVEEFAEELSNFEKWWKYFFD